MQSETKLIHAVPVDPLTGAISVPIYQTSTFVQEAPGVHLGFDYSRSNNPTRKVVEDLIAGLEEGSNGFAFSSGLAAIDAVLKLLKSGDEILAVDDVYGGSFRIFTHVYEKFGIRVKYIDTSDVQEVINNISGKTKFVWLESPTNPTLKISDIEVIAGIAHHHGALLVVDNTFASPALQRPLLLGADIIIHSATKYLGGHSDLIARAGCNQNGRAGCTDQVHSKRFRCSAGTFRFLAADQGIETLFLRMEKHCSNAQLIAEYLKHSLK
jgi:cystathionine beta-lyase